MAKEGAKHEHKHNTGTDYYDTIHTHTQHKCALQHTVSEAEDR